MDNFYMYIIPRRNGKFVDVHIAREKIYSIHAHYLCEINPEDVGEIAIEALSNPKQFLGDILGEEPVGDLAHTTFFYAIHQENETCEESL